MFLAETDLDQLVDLCHHAYFKVELPTIGETYDTLEEAIVLISDLLPRLAFMLMGADITLKNFERRIKEDVVIFWDQKRTRK
jgi:hypothetical protein